MRRCEPRCWLSTQPKDLRIRRRSFAVTNQDSRWLQDVSREIDRCLKRRDGQWKWFHHHTKQVLSLAQLQGGSRVGNPAASVTDEPPGFVTMTSTVPGSRQGGFVTRIPLRRRTGDFRRERLQSIERREPAHRALSLNSGSPLAAASANERAVPLRQGNVPEGSASEPQHRLVRRPTLCPVVAARSVLENERYRQPVGRKQRGTDAWDSAIEMDHRDVPDRLCPSGVADRGVFVFR